MKKVLLFLILISTSVLTFGQTEVDIWKKSKIKKIFSTRKFSFPRKFISTSPSGRIITYEKVDHPKIKVETSSGQQLSNEPVIYKSESDFGSISYDGKNWSGIHTEDGFNISNLSEESVTTTKMDGEKFTFGEQGNTLRPPSKKNRRIGQSLVNEPKYYDPKVKIKKKCKIYVEVTNDLYRFWGSNTNKVIQNVTTIVTNVMSIYDREGIDIVLNKIYIWDKKDPYGNPFDNTQYLYKFTENINQNIPTNPESHFKHLLHNKNLGGIAWINGETDGYITNPNLDPYYTCAVTGIGSNSVVNSNITYSWSVMCFAHEMGHNLGSNHTQFCGWRNEWGQEIGRLDSCYQAENSSGPENCNQTNYTKLKSNTKGTIMSYCHLNGQISFLEGFGKYPRYAIRSNLDLSPEIPSEESSVLEVKTGDIISIGRRTATLSGSVPTNSNSTINSRGFVWSKTTNINIDINTKINLGGGTGDFQTTIQGLEPETQYYYNTFAVNQEGTVLGQIKGFITLPENLPSVSTTEITILTKSTMTCGFKINNSGYDGNVTSSGVVWSRNINPVLDRDQFTQQLPTGNQLSLVISNINNLLPNTKYYVRAYAVNPLGISYGNQIEFTTPSESNDCTINDLIVYQNNLGRWCYRFKLNSGCDRYTVNVCRYNSNNSNQQPNPNLQPTNCGIRNNIRNYRPTQSELSSSTIEREMVPQPQVSIRSGNGGLWYSVDVSCNSQSCRSNNTQKKYFWVPFSK